MEFYERVLAARKAKGLSQEALAEALGVSRQAVSKWETGESKPDLDKLIGLCNTLELSMEYLCLGKETADTPTPAPVSAPAQKRMHPVLKVFVAVLCAAALFTGGIFTASSFLITQPVVSTNEQQEPDAQAALDNIRIINAVPSRVIGTRKLELTVTPSMVPEGLEVGLLLQQKDRTDTTIACTHTGSYDFTATIAHGTSPFEYRVTAVLKLGDAEKLIPLLVLHGDGDISNMGWVSLLEESSDADTPQSMISCQTVLDALAVNPVINCVGHPEATYKSTLCFAANAYPTGLQLQLRFEYMGTPYSMNPIVCCAMYNGTHFIMDASTLPVGYRYRVTAILTLGGIQREIDLTQIFDNSLSGGGWTTLG